VVFAAIGMFVPAGGQIGTNTPLIQGLQVDFGTIAGVGPRSPWGSCPCWRYMTQLQQTRLRNQILRRAR
jgi:hypothetical protein